MKLCRYAIAPSAFILACGITACGGGTADISGTVSGLPAGSSVTLQNNATNDLTVSANGSFLFTKTLANNASYSVTVLTQPSGAICTVSNAAGTTNANGDDVNNVSVVCTANASITGTLSGLATGTFVMLANGSTTLPVVSNGSFAFPGILATGTAYNVVVNVQPSEQVCTVSNGSGTLAASRPTPVSVACV